MQVLHVKAGTTVWISNFAKNWESNNDTIHDLGDLNYSGNKGLNMAKDMYGYMDAEVVGKTGEVYEPVIPVDSIRHGGTGEKATVTFTNTATNQSVHTEAYKLGSFTEDKDIFLYVTLPDGRYGDSYAMIGNNGKLGSRMDNEYDVAGNTRFNWQFRDGNGYQGYEIEFIAFYSVNEEPHEPVGQPLPGVFFSSIVGLGSVVVARLRKRDVDRKSLHLRLRALERIHTEKLVAVLAFHVETPAERPGALLPPGARPGRYDIRRAHRGQKLIAHISPPFPSLPVFCTAGRKICAFAATKRVFVFARFTFLPE